MTPILEAKNLKKHFIQSRNRIQAVDGVDLKLQAGRCLGLLGPNGAGKTTTIEILEGIQDASEGEIWFQGEKLGGPRSASIARYRERTGIQFQSTALPDYLKVREVLKLFQSLYSRRMDLDEVIALCHLGELLDRDSDRLSGGQRQRLLLALALVGDPDLIFLDEPTTGLDPQARRNFWDLVRTVRARGKTLLLTTHYMEEAHELCDEIAIMDRGRIVAQGTPEVLLKHHFEGNVIELPLDAFPRGEVPAVLPGKMRTFDGRLEVQSTSVNATLQALLASGAALDHIKVRSRTLEDLFLELTGKDLRT
jgi:ABC-2 type transport system ATP-binding protein